MYPPAKLPPPPPPYGAIGRRLSEGLYRAPSPPGAGVRRQALIVSLGDPGPDGPLDGMARLFFVGPRQYAISDEGGNFLPGEEEVGVDGSGGGSSALSMMVDLKWGECSDGGYNCKFDTSSSQIKCVCMDPPEFDDTSDPVATGGGIIGVTIGEMEAAVPLLLVMLMLLLLACCYGLRRTCLRYLAIKRRNKIEEKLEKLSGLSSVIKSAVSSRASCIIKLLLGPVSIAN